MVKHADDTEVANVLLLWQICVYQLFMNDVVTVWYRMYNYNCTITAFQVPMYSQGKTSLLGAHFLTLHNSNEIML